MSSWSQRRKTFYFLIFTGFLFGFIILPAYLIFYKPPTCDDGKQNGDEKGIDCGGSCVKLCRSQYLDPNIIWTRAIKVKSGIYNIIAYIENPNIDAGVDFISYNFKIKDKDGVLIYEKKGDTFIPPNKFFAVFEDRISMGEKIPTKILFEFTGGTVWKKQENKEAGITVLKKTISYENYLPRVDAVLENHTLESIFKIEVVAIVYDKYDNAVGFSRTFIDKLEKRESQSITFTWPEPLVSDVVKIEIIPRIYGEK